MAIKLNLLPPGYGVPGSLGKFLKLTRMLGVVAIAFFLVFTLGISAFFVLSTVTLKSLNSDLDSLKSQIIAQESTEQQVILLKDRVGKIKIALGLPSAIKNLDNAGQFISGLPPTGSLKDLSADFQKVDFSVQFSSTNDLSTFINAISGSKTFASVAMTTFTFNPGSGYLVSMRLSVK